MFGIYRLFTIIGLSSREDHHHLVACASYRRTLILHLRQFCHDRTVEIDGRRILVEEIVINDVVRCLIGLCDVVVLHEGNKEVLSAEEAPDFLDGLALGIHLLLG